MLVTPVAARCAANVGIAAAGQSTTSAVGLAAMPQRLGADRPGAAEDQNLRSLVGHPDHCARASGIDRSPLGGQAAQNRSGSGTHPNGAVIEALMSENRQGDSAAMKVVSRTTVLALGALATGGVGLFEQFDGDRDHLVDVGAMSSAVSVSFQSGVVVGAGRSRRAGSARAAPLPNRYQADPGPSREWRPRP